MESAKNMQIIETLNKKAMSDFYKVPNLKFDIQKLRTDLEIILKMKNFNSLGIKSFGAIPINQIPGDKSSTEGHNVRGTYWTIPDESGKEAMRDKPIDESKYTELLPEFRGTYFEEVFNTLKKQFKLGRIRILLKEPRSTLSWHRDPEPRLHIPIITNKGCRMVIGEVSKHMPADGSVTITNNTKYHNFFNGGEQNRIHLVACVLDNPFN
mgnify:FL=1|tara:strand:+ start:311 stop:940 length:630 start_codon:yes stop_codon:yes gene_type:complete